jgi:hypothetical protein
LRREVEDGGDEPREQVGKTVHAGAGGQHTGEQVSGCIVNRVSQN